MQMKSCVEVLKPYNVKIMIGGAPVTQKYADEIGADAYASDSATAVEKANQFLAS